MSLNFMATFALLLTCGRKKRVIPIVAWESGVSGGKGEKCHLKSPPPPPPPLGRPDTLAMPAYSVVSMHAHKTQVTMLYLLCGFLLFRNTTVIVKLENVNDNTPSFTKVKYVFTANEVGSTLYVLISHIFSVSKDSGFHFLQVILKFKTSLASQ